MTTTGETATDSASPWAGGRFFLVAGILFVAQVGMIMLVGEHPHKLTPRPSETTSFRALPDQMNQNQISESFFVADPTVFASATPHGFSGRAWLSFQPVKYGPAEELEPALLLSLDNRHLGANLRLEQETNEVPFPLAESRGAQAEPLPVFSTPSVARTQSVYHVEGPLAAHLLGPVVAISSWPTNELLKNSVVAFAVDRSGQVILQRLLTRSGISEADIQAVAVTRALRFLPLNATNSPLTWAKAIFQWQTIEPPAK